MKFYPQQFHHPLIFVSCPVWNIYLSHDRMRTEIQSQTKNRHSLETIEKSKADNRCSCVQSSPSTSSFTHSSIQKSFHTLSSSISHTAHQSLGKWPWDHLPWLSWQAVAKYIPLTSCNTSYFEFSWLQWNQVKPNETTFHLTQVHASPIAVTKPTSISCESLTQSRAVQPSWKDGSWEVSDKSESPPSTLETPPSFSLFSLDAPTSTFFLPLPSLHFHLYSSPTQCLLIPHLVWAAGSQEISLPPTEMLSAVCHVHDLVAGQSKGRFALTYSGGVKCTCNYNQTLLKSFAYAHYHYSELTHNSRLR